VRTLRKRVKYLVKKIASSERPSIFWKVWSLISTPLNFGLAMLSLLVFWPRMTVDAENQIDPANPHPIMFKVTNTGLLTLRDVKPMLGICQYGAKVNSLETRCNGALRSRLVPLLLHAGTLQSDEKDSFRLDDVFNLLPGVRLEGADISIVINYNLPAFNFICVYVVSCEAEFRFITREEADGKLSWQSRSSTTPAVKR
jgi:hypothetical protein